MCGKRNEGIQACSFGQSPFSLCDCVGELVQSENITLVRLDVAATGALSLAPVANQPGFTCGQTEPI